MPAQHSSGLIATRRGGTRHPITAKRLTYGTLAGATILGSLAVPVAAFASPTNDDNAPLTQADWIPLEGNDDVSYDDTTYDPATMEPSATGDGRAQLYAWPLRGHAGVHRGPGRQGNRSGPDATDSTPPALPPAANDWDGVAMCESSGDWQANTGNGYFGGLQFWQPTWDELAARRTPSVAHLASRNSRSQSPSVCCTAGTVSPVKASARGRRAVSTSRTSHQRQFPRQSRQHQSAQSPSARSPTRHAPPLVETRSRSLKVLRLRSASCQGAWMASTGRCRKSTPSLAMGHGREHRTRPGFGAGSD